MGWNSFSRFPILLGLYSNPMERTPTQLFENHHQPCKYPKTSVWMCDFKCILPKLFGTEYTSKFHQQWRCCKPQCCLLCCYCGQSIYYIDVNWLTFSKYELINLYSFTTRMESKFNILNLQSWPTLDLCIKSS